MPVSLNALALLDDRRKASVEIAATKGKVAAKMLSNRAGASIRTSSLALKGLAADGVLVLRGRVLATRIGTMSCRKAHRLAIRERFGALRSAPKLWKAGLLTKNFAKAP